MIETAGAARPVPATARKVVSVRAAGTRAVLAELAGTQDVLALQALLLASPLPGQLDVLAAARTVLVTADSPGSTRRIAAALLELNLAATAQRDGGLVIIDTVYDGEDLAEVAELTGLGRDGVVAAHTGQVWTVAFAGFAPGFGYMVGEDPALEVPRRSSPRTAVPAGAVALAGTYSAVYPRRSPGGWQLIGRTNATMWDLDREQPALAAPGQRIQFRAVREAVELAPEAREDPVSDATEDSTTGPAASPATNPPANAADGASADLPADPPAAERAAGLRVVATGLQSLIQDLGRFGHSGLGVSAAGALDRSSLRRANRLVGNASTAAAIETVAGGLSVRAVGDQVLAVTGAPCLLSIETPAGGSPQTAGGPETGDDAEPGWRTVPVAAPFALLDGETLTLGAPDTGLRSYLAVRGGLAVAPVLGSRSTDTLSGIGPAPLAAGHHLAAGGDADSGVVGHPELQPDFPGTAVTVLDVVPGPRADWFDQAALDSLTGQDWQVTPRSNRVGMRLDGTPLQRSRDGELPSEGTVSGALQVPPEGLPVLFLADHPITGGYPVIAVVVDSQLDLAAQVPIGGAIRFRWSDAGAHNGAVPSPAAPNHAALDDEVSN